MLLQTNSKTPEEIWNKFAPQITFQGKVRFIYSYRCLIPAAVLNMTS